MSHIDEHILELYLLNAPEVAGRRDTIASHLAECAGCAALAIEIGGFHADLTKELETRLVEEENAEQAIVPVGRKLPRLRVSSEIEEVFPSSRGTLSRFGYFVRQHPIVAGAGAVAAMAIAAAMVLIFMGSIKDDNPVSIHYYINNNMIEVLNKKYEKLWDISASRIADVPLMEESRRVRFTDAVDVNSDGKNEIITTLQLDEDRSTGGYYFRIFSAAGKCILKRDFIEEFHYLQRQYPPQFIPGEFYVDTVGGEKEIFVQTGNLHSPSFLARLDTRGNSIGEFWHFGRMLGIYPFVLKASGKKVLIICGINDTNDSTYRQYPVIIVLDPSKIVGKVKSSCTPGYALPTSDAELYYIRLPLCDINDALHINATNTHLFSSDGLLEFETVGGGNEQQPVFEYVFDHSMNPREVKLATTTTSFRDSLIQAGKIPDIPWRQYLDNLKQNVRYWDGNEWRKEAVMVRHSAENEHLP